MSKPKMVKLVAKILISLAFIGVIVFKVEWADVLGYVREINIWLVGIYIVLYLVSTVISGYKWQIIARSKKFFFSLWDFSTIYLTGAFINNFMPSFLGGDTYRSYEIGKKSENRYVEAASTVLLDRVTGFLAAMILVIFFSVLNIAEVSKSPLLLIINFLVLASFGTDVALVVLRKSFLWKYIRKYIPQSVIDVGMEMKSFNSDRSTLFLSVIWGIIFNILGVAILNFILFWALGIHISLLDYASVIFLISIISSVPLSINNIGINEWAYITFFGIFGADPAAVVTVSIIARFLKMFGSFFALPIYLKDRNWKERFMGTKNKPGLA